MMVRVIATRDIMVPVKAGAEVELDEATAARYRGSVRILRTRKNTVSKKED